jgi:hypothetical protein
MKFFGIRSSNKLATDVAIGTEPHQSIEPDHGGEKSIPTTNNDYDISLEEKPAQDLQAGVKKVEAVTLTWTRNELVFAYGW